MVHVPNTYKKGGSMAEAIAKSAIRADAGTTRRHAEELAAAVGASRRRCAAAGIDKNAETLPRVTRKDIEIARKNVLGGIAYTRKTHLGYLNSFNGLIAAFGGAVFYLDHSLHVCGLGGDEALLDALKARNIKFGADLSEERAGTNAAALARELMYGCRLDPQESYCAAFRDYACFSQGPIKIGIDDFIIAFVMVPAGNLSETNRPSIEHALLTLGIISLRNERLHADASSALLDIFMARRGLGYAIVDENERIVGVSQNFLDAFNLQGSRTVGSYARNSIPELGPVLDACPTWRENDIETKIEGLSIGGLPAWAIAVTVPAGEARLFGIAVKSARFGEERPEGGSGDAAIEAFVGSSAIAADLRSRMRKIASRDDNVLIVGRSGTGKGTAARALHNASPRRHAPFLALDCALLTDSNAEQILFGSSGQPGLFERTTGGTLFLDGIESLPPRAQVMLGKVLEDGSLSLPGRIEMERGATRILLAADHDLRELAAGHAVSQDLLHRMPPVVLRMPSLQDRPEDVPAIARHLMEACASRSLGHAGEVPCERSFQHLAALPWPGEIRELKNALERALVEADLNGETLESAIRNLAWEHGALGEPPSSTWAADPGRGGSVSPDRAAPPRTLESYERNELLAALASAHGNKSAAAKSLGITRKTLYARMRKHGLIE